MDEDVSKCRRNLLIASSILIIFEVAGVSISSIESLGLSLSFKNPELLKYFIWVIMFYELIRFLRITKEKFDPHEIVISKYIKNNHKIKKYLEQNYEKYIEVTEKYPHIKRGVFSRKLAFIENESGHMNEKEAKIGYFFSFMPELLSDIKYAAYDLDFIEYKLPYSMAVGAIAIPIIKLYLEKIAS